MIRGAIAAVLLLRAAAIPAPCADLVHPLEPETRVTSTFGEYRPGHYHGGLDFSTGGASGLPVHAPGSGWLYRVRASGIGYGRSAYLRLDDGKTVVFAHLSDWRADVARAVTERQMDLGRYEIDWYPEPEAFRFQAGEVLGYTGSSGAGPPHLHVEVRTGPTADTAVNPLQFGWGAPDSTAPLISQLRWAPRTPHAGLQKLGATVPLNGGPARFTTRGPVRLWICAFDRSDQGGRLGLKALQVLVDGATAQVVDFESFNWNNPGEVEWTYDEARAREFNEPWICLDAPPESNHHIYAREVMPTPEVGEHRLELVAVDEAGLITRRTLQWMVEPGTATPEADSGEGNFRVSPHEPSRLTIPGVYVDLPRGAVYETVDVSLSRGERPQPDGELIPVSVEVHLEPWALPLRKRVEVGILWPRYDPSVAVYSRHEDGWSYEGAEPTLGGVRTGIRNLESLALFRDVTAPRVALRAPGVSSRPKLQARIEENGAGVTWKTLRMELDGALVVAEWDPESGMLTGSPFEPLAPGDHRLSVYAEDRVGNRAVSERVFSTR